MTSAKYIFDRDTALDSESNQRTKQLTSFQSTPKEKSCVLTHPTRPALVISFVLHLSRHSTCGCRATVRDSTIVSLNESEIETRVECMPSIRTHKRFTVERNETREKRVRERSSTDASEREREELLTDKIQNLSSHNSGLYE